MISIAIIDSYTYHSKNYILLFFSYISTKKYKGPSSASYLILVVFSKECLSISNVILFLFISITTSMY